MKPLCLSLGAMALILAFSLWTGWYVHLQTDGWRELLEQAAAAAACVQRDGREFTAQLTLLQVRLGLLAETQAISIKNIL